MGPHVGKVNRDRILFVSPSSPFEVSSGTHQRSRLLYRAVCRLGDVDVAVIQHGTEVSAVRADTDGARAVDATVPERQDFSRFDPSPPLTAAIEAALATSIGSYRIVVGRHLWPVTQIAVPAAVPVIADVDDFRYRYSRNASLTAKVLAERVRKYLSHRLTRHRMLRLQGAFFASDRDRRDLPGLESAVLPNVPVNVPSAGLPDAANARILFVGSLWYRPNREGVDWFLDRVWPQVLREIPAADFRLIGAASEEVRSRWKGRPRVTAPGFAEDLAAEYAAASFVVSPVQSGGGTNIKVLEALAYGRACVSSDFCLQAFGDALQRGRDLLVAGDADAFAARCIDLLRDAAQRSEIARNGRAAVLEHFSVDAFEAIATGFVSRVMARGS